MKNVISLLVLTLFFSSTVLAQVKYGIKAGANFGDIMETIEITTDNFGEVEPLDYELRINPQIGVWFDLPLVNQLSLQTEVLWTQKAMLRADNNPMDTYLNFHYFSVPVLAKYKLGKFRIEAGPELSFLVDQAFRNNDGGLEESPSVEENSLEFAVNLGVQYEHKRWIIGARASRDVTSFQEINFTDINGEAFGDVRNFHQSGVIWVGYQIR